MRTRDGERPGMGGVRAVVEAVAIVRDAQVATEIARVVDALDHLADEAERLHAGDRLAGEIRETRRRLRALLEEEKKGPAAA